MEGRPSLWYSMLPSMSATWGFWTEDGISLLATFLEQTTPGTT